MRRYAYIEVLLLLNGATLATAGDGVVIVRVVDDATDRPLPARVYVTSQDGKPHLPKPRTGETIVRYDRHTGEAHEVYASIGPHPFRIDAPAEKLTVTIEHGKEYEPLTREIDVIEGRTIEETFRLHRLFNMASEGWYSGEMHVHSGVKRLPAMQLAEDLNVAFPINSWTFSDRRVPEAHDGEPMPDHGELVKLDDTHVYWSLNTEYELDETRGDVPLGGFLVLGHTSPFKIAIPPLRPLIEEARRQRAIFEWDMHTWPWSMMVVPVLPIDTVPLSNCHMWRLKPHYLDWGVKSPAWMRCDATAAGWAEYTFQAYYALLNCGFTVAPSAGTANGVHPVPLGYSRVYVHLDGPFSYEKWKAGLLAGHSFVTNGPMLLLHTDGLMPGDRRALKPGENANVTVDIEARSVGQLDRTELVINGKAIPIAPDHAEPGNNAHLHRYHVPLEIKGSSWLAARCFEKLTPDNLRFAHTAPIYLDDPTRPLLPDRQQIAWLIQRVQSQIDLLKGKVPADVMAEYERALSTYQSIARKLPAATSAPAR